MTQLIQTVDAEKVAQDEPENFIPADYFPVKEKFKLNEYLLISCTFSLIKFCYYKPINSSVLLIFVGY